jgi:hypothetical protein
MAVERPAGAIRFMFRINVQHYSCNFTPVSTFRVRIEQAKIRNKLFLVVNGQTGIGGRRIGDIRIKRGASAGAAFSQHCHRTVASGSLAF